MILSNLSSPYCFSDPFDLILARNRKLEQQHKPLPIYAQDQDATLFRANAPGINLLKTTDETFLKKLLAAGCLGAEGVTSPYLYFGRLFSMCSRYLALSGMSGTTFATHLEVCRQRSVLTNRVYLGC